MDDRMEYFYPDYFYKGDYLMLSILPFFNNAIEGVQERTTLEGKNSMKYFNHNQKELSELSIEKSEKQTTNFVYSVLEYQFIPFPSERISNLNTMFKKKYPEYSFNVKNFDFYKSINYPRFWYNIFYNYYIYFKTNVHK